MKLFDSWFKKKTFTPLHVNTHRPLRKFKNFPESTTEPGWMLTKKQNQALLLVLDAMQRNSRGGFTWDEIALSALDVLIEYGYLDGLKNSPMKIEEQISNPLEKVFCDCRVPLPDKSGICTVCYRNVRKALLEETKS